MNQRVKRAKKGKGQDISGATMSTGGHVVKHDRGVEPVVRTPQKTNGDVSGKNLAGLAKASPLFQKIAGMIPKSKDEEKKIVASAVEEVVEEKEKKLEE